MRYDDKILEELLLRTRLVLLMRQHLRLRLQLLTRAVTAAR
ncbi:hypothetical protein [Nonomuraea insulae]|uniref:Uncharacterized protein n=1 Tax=Nonomuraea insulae TaxID=1616787 RepID=A0ABW1D2W5_9ACTN